MPRPWRMIQHWSLGDRRLHTGQKDGFPEKIRGARGIELMPGMHALSCPRHRAKTDVFRGYAYQQAEKEGRHGQF